MSVRKRNTSRWAVVAGSLVVLASASSALVLADESTEQPVARDPYASAGCDGISEPIRHEINDFLRTSKGSDTQVGAVNAWLSEKGWPMPSASVIEDAVATGRGSSSGLTVSLPDVTLSLIALPDGSQVVAAAIWCWDK